MSQSVNVNFAKCFIIFMAVAILLQGVLYLGLSVWGILLHNCTGESSDLRNKPFDFVLNLVYFSSETCGPPTLHLSDMIPDVTLEIDYSIADVINYREFIFLITYAAVSTLWVVTSLFVLVTICGPVTKIVAAICFWPWLLVILAGSILDAVATGYHVKDILETSSADSAFKYVGVINADVVLDVIKEYDIFFMTPALVFTCISSRIVLVWVLNIVGSIFCLSLAKVLAANNTDKKKDKTPHRLPVDTTVPTQPRTQNDEQMQEIQQQDPVVLRYQPTAPPTDLARRERRTMEPLRTSQEQSPPTEFIDPYLAQIARQQSTTSNKRVNEIKTQASVMSITPSYQSSDSHPENLDYPNNNRYSPPVPAHAPPQSPRSATPELSAISPLNMRYSNTEGLPFPNQPHVSQELRGQLPWSYTNIMNDPIAQKRIQAHMQPDEQEFPPIPVPDYTLHHPKRERGPINPDNQSQMGYSRW